MREYSTCKSNEDVVFNDMARSAHNLIECAFGQVKARWQVLTKKMDFKLFFFFFSTTNVLHKNVK